MASIIEQKLKSKKTEINDIDRKVQTEQITPTVREKKSIGDIIQVISTQYRRELTDNTINKKELDEKIIRTIQSEIEKLPVNYEKKRRLEKLAISNIIGLGPLQQYLDNPMITEIVVQRYDNIVIESKGKIHSVKACFSDEEALQNVINRILQPTVEWISVFGQQLLPVIVDGNIFLPWTNTPHGNGRFETLYGSNCSERDRRSFLDAFGRSHFYASVLFLDR